MTKVNPFEMLYRARWNVPRASLELGLVPCEESWEKVKTLFKEWCEKHPRDYDVSPSRSSGE